MLPENWVVLNDGSDLFKNSVIPYMNKICGDTHKGNIIKAYYGVCDGYSKCNYLEELIKYNPTIVTLQYFINLTEMKIETTKERILSAAEKCSQAKTVLKELFPEVFENDVNVEEMWGSHLQVRSSPSKFKDKAFYLSDDYNWRIEKDNIDQLCLIPTRK